MLENSSLSPVSLMLLEDKTLCAFWDVEGAAPARPDSFLYGENKISSPYARLDVPLGADKQRRFLVFRAAHQPESLLSVREKDGETAAMGNLSVTLAELLDGLPLASRHRVCRFILDTARNLFRINSEEYAATCQKLLRRAFSNIPVVSAVLECGGLPGYALLPMSTHLGTIQKAYVLSSTGMDVLRQSPRPLDKQTLLLCADKTAQFDSPDGLVVLLDDQQQVALARLARPYAPRVHVVEWLHRNRPHHAAIRTQLFKDIAAREEGAFDYTAAQQVLADVEVLAPLPPKKVTSSKDPVGGAVDWAITQGIGGVFIKGWIRDPRHLIHQVELTCHGETVALLENHWHTVPRPDLDRHYKDPTGSSQGFIAFIPESVAGRCLAPTVQLTLASGVTISLVPSILRESTARKRTAILACLPGEQITAAVLDRLIAPPITRLQEALAVVLPEPQIYAFGPPDPAVPRWSVVIPLYRNLDYVRHQLAAFALDADMAHTEIVYILDSPEQEGQLKHYLRGLAGVYPVAVRLLVMPENGGYSTANNVAAQHARGEYLMLLNSDVVPTAPGWLSALTATLERHEGAAAVGARLLFEDQSLQHAGMYFAQDAGGHWLNLHYYKGAPRDYPPALLEREVPAITGAAVLLRKDDFDAVGGFTRDYVIGDYEDSDLCLKLRAKGGSIWYSPNAVLYHFERKSISKHQGYTDSIAGLYNRRFAAQRWGSTMADVMESVGEQTWQFV